MTTWPLHNDFTFQLPNDQPLRVSSNFDSGNLESASFWGTQLFLLPGFDCLGQDSLKPSAKTFFHFRVCVLSPIVLTLRIGRVKILKRLFEVSNLLTRDGEMAHYRVCIKKKREKEYKRYEQQPLIEKNENEELQLLFTYQFQEKDEVYFAFSYPYSYVRMVELVRRLDAEYKNDQDIYLAKEVLTYSLQGRLVPMLTITSHDNKSTVFEQRISNSMFPECILQNRPWKFRKPVVMITCRVHPGQTPSSYALEGILEFLLNKQDYRASMLRKLFTFIVIPMMNPDGVHRGMYRMDTKGQNLNRFYNFPHSHKHPSVFAARCLMSYYQRQKKMFAYYDLHAHSRRRGLFLYGNACTEYIQQVQTKLFAKLLSLNCSHVNHQLCNFSQAQMVFKDSAQMLSKQGCGRVVAYKITGVTHSYTLQLGFHSTERNDLSAQSNTDLKIDGLGYVDYGENRQGMFTQVSFKEGGRAMLISLLDLLELNPYSRVINDKEKSIQGLRQQVAKQIYDHEQRFKQLDPNVLKKLRTINQLAKQTIQAELAQRFPSFDRQNLPRMQSESIVQKINAKVFEEPQPFTNASIEMKQEENSTVGATQQVEMNPEKETDKQFVIFRDRIRDLRRQHQRKQRAHSSVKQVVVVSRPRRDIEQQARLIKPLKLDFDPFPRFQRRGMFNFIKKSLPSNQYPCRGNILDISLQRQSLNLPSLTHRQSTSSSRSPDTIHRSPFTVQLRIRRNLQLKYGIRQRDRERPTDLD